MNFGKIAPVMMDFYAQVAEQILLTCPAGPALVFAEQPSALCAQLFRGGGHASEASMDVDKLRLFPEATYETLVVLYQFEQVQPDLRGVVARELHRVTKSNLYVRVKLGASGEFGSKRNDWEDLFFAAGFRKHPSYYLLNTYESLNQDGAEILILLQKIESSVLKDFSIADLLKERDLHMDMCRESGSRSDAHIARYNVAAKFVRQGDRVLDAACGLGYGASVLCGNSKAGEIVGIDGSESAVRYASALYGNSFTRFESGFLPETLSRFEDGYFDTIVSFETLEHVKDPDALLKEFYRVLSPGGRIVVSVPNDWSDETGEDPNPYHFHVYDYAKLKKQVTARFAVESVVAQTADRAKLGGGGPQWIPKGRSFWEVNPDAENSDVESEWWIVTAMKSPWATPQVYQERHFSTAEVLAAKDALAFARDYENPWLIRAIVARGLRVTNTKVLEDFARTGLSASSEASADLGACLCVLAYAEFERGAGPSNAISERIQDYLKLAPQNPTVLRWQISLSYLNGLELRRKGRLSDALLVFRGLTQFPFEKYSPTLLTKYAEAILFCGEIEMAFGRSEAAEAILEEGYERLTKDLAGWFSSAQLDSPLFEFREIADVVTLSLRIASARKSMKLRSRAPSIYFAEVRADSLQKLKHMERLEATLAQLTREKRELSLEVKNLKSECHGLKRHVLSGRDHLRILLHLIVRKFRNSIRFSLNGGT